MLATICAILSVVCSLISIFTVVFKAGKIIQRIDDLEKNILYNRDQIDKLRDKQSPKPYISAKPKKKHKVYYELFPMTEIK